MSWATRSFRSRSKSSGHGRLHVGSILAVCFAGLVALLSVDHAHAQPSPRGTTDANFYAPPFAAEQTRWHGSDEAWYRQNRRFALAGKVLTVVGLATTLAVGVPTDLLAPVLAGLSVQYAGQLMWAGSELRGANGLRRRGVEVPRVGAIVALCGALLLSPVTWIAGPIQSARTRTAHAQASGAGGSHASSPAFTGVGMGVRARF